MNGFETLEFFSYTIALAANVVVAGVCFKAFHTLRLAPLKLIAISASIAVFTTFADFLVLPKTYDDSTYAFIWTGITILWTIDIILYALGITKLVSWIIMRKSGEHDESLKP